MIYVIEAAEIGRVKIGFTRHDPRKRLASFQTMSPVRLRIRTIIDGDLRTEGILHNALKEHQVIGEWFADGEHISEAIEKLNLLQAAARWRSPKRLSALLTTLREKTGLSQESTASVIGYGAPAWIAMENGDALPGPVQLGRFLSHVKATRDERSAVFAAYAAEIDEVKPLPAQEVTR